MTASEKSFIGLALQTAKGTPNETDNQFTYVLFRNGSIAPQNVVIPLDSEVGGGAMIRGMSKVGVTSGGALDLIWRPNSLGWFLYGVLGQAPDSRPTKLTEVLAKENLPASQAEAVGTKTNPPYPPGAELCVTGYPAGSTLTGNVLIDGTDPDDQALTDITFALDFDKTVLATGHDIFKTVTSIMLPAYTTDGDQVSVGYVDGSYTHIFTHPTSDQFNAPYWTFRSAPGFLLGEQFQDCRIANSVINFAGGRFVDGATAVLGGLPKVVATTTWDALDYVDAGPQFLGVPNSDIELPLATNLKVLSGSVAFGNVIPLDEQWIVGSYVPDDFDINQKSVVITYNVKITDKDLYEQMLYDPDQGGDWVASLFKEASMKLFVESPEDAENSGFTTTTTKYSLDIKGKAADDNIIWSAAPIGLRAGRQVIMSITGVMLNASTGGVPDPLTVTLINNQADYVNP